MGDTKEHLDVATHHRCIVGEVHGFKSVYIHAMVDKKWGCHKCLIYSKTVLYRNSYSNYKFRQVLKRFVEHLEKDHQTLAKEEYS